MTKIVLPTPERIIPGFSELPAPIQAVIERLSTPFPVEEVKVRPGAVRRDGSAALCLAYSDWWTGYLPRLNDEVGPNNWQITLRPWGDHQIIARLDAFDGLIVSESSGNAKGDANGAQEAEVQAKKRACAEGLMLGLYYYFLPPVWGKGERTGKDFAFHEGEERRCVWEMYHRAGLIARSTPAIELPRATPRVERGHEPTADTPAPHVEAAAEPARKPLPIQERAATARAALDTAERSVGLRPEGAKAREHASGARTERAAASEAQLGLIARLVNTLRTHDAADDRERANAINRVGTRFGIPGLADLRSKDKLRAAAQLTKLNATKLIDALKALDPNTIAHAA